MTDKLAQLRAKQAFYRTELREIEAQIITLIAGGEAGLDEKLIELESSGSPKYSGTPIEAIKEVLKCQDRVMTVAELAMDLAVAQMFKKQSKGKYKLARLSVFQGLKHNHLKAKRIPPRAIELTAEERIGLYEWPDEKWD